MTHSMNLRPARSMSTKLSTRLALSLAAICCTTLGAHAQEPPAKAPTAVAPAALPDAKTIIERGVAAAGGREAWSKHTSMEMKGTMEMPAQGMKGPMVSRMATPNKMTMSIDFPGVGMIRTGFDGTVGWAMDKISGPRLMTGHELETMVQDAEFMREADPMRRWDKFETTGEGKLGGFDCWKIEASKNAPASKEKDAAAEPSKEPATPSKATLWYEKSTGLQRGMDMVVDTQLGKIPVKTVILEYKEFGGLQLPTRTEATQMGQKIVTTYETITFDTVDAKTFELPTEVKALLEPEPADEDAPAKPAEAPKAPAAPAAPATPKS